MLRLTQNFRQIIMRNKSTETLEDKIARIQKMEQYFDEILEARMINPNIIKDDENIREKFQELLTYYGNGQWMHDYECDEQGELPSDLKRGILSEDGLYNLLTEVENDE